MASRLALNLTKPSTPNYAVIDVQADIATSQVVLLAVEEVVEHHWGMVVRVSIVCLPLACSPCPNLTFEAVWRVSGFDHVGGYGAPFPGMGPDLRLDRWRGSYHCVPVAAHPSGA